MRLTRVYVPVPLAGLATLQLPEGPSGHLARVLRLEVGAALTLFDGRGGEYAASITAIAKQGVSVSLGAHQAVERESPLSITLLQGISRGERMDLIVQKATELGARRLRPVITARTIAERVNLERMRANVVEAAEQCNLVFVPEVLEPVSLNAALRDWDAGRALIYCDEVAEKGGAVAALSRLKTPAAVLVGPEGGFTVEERAMLKALPYVTAISLGPRIMRADTAGVAVMTLAQAVLGDWG